jgi:hypothetical protein
MWDMPGGWRNVAQFCGLVLLGLTAAASANAAPNKAAQSKWQEWHQSGDDVRIAVTADGSALVERQIRYRVVAGVFKGFELPVVEKGVVPNPEVEVTAQDGARVTARLERDTEPKKPAEGAPAVDADLLRVVLDDQEKGLRRGSYTFKLSYKVDLTRPANLDRDSAMWRLTWVSPPSQEGRDVAKVVFELPSAPTPPKVAPFDPLPGAPAGAVADELTTMANVRRMPDHDAIELVRPHVARGESVRWAVRVDPKAFPKLQAEVAPAAIVHGAEPAPVASPRVARWVLAALVVALGVAFGLLVRAKDSDVARLAAAHGAEPQPLLPLGRHRPVLAGGATLAGAALVALAGVGAAGALVAIGALFAVHRPPRGAAGRRAGGGWVPLRPSDAFDRAPRRPSWLDVTTRRGVVALGGLVVAVSGAVGGLVATTSPSLASLVALFGVACLPAFVTGVASQIGPRVGRASAALERAHRGLAEPGTIVRALGLVGRGANAAAEVRVWASPEVSIVGFGGVEIASLISATLAGRRERLELVVRVLDGSPAHDRIVALVPGATTQPGRRPEERVMTLAPPRGDADGAIELARRVVDVVRERRVAKTGAAHAGAERRQPREVRARTSAPPARGGERDRKDGLELAPAFGA